MHFLLFQRNAGLMDWIAQEAKQQLRRFSPECLTQAPLDTVTAGRLGRSPDLGSVPDTWGSPHNIKPPCVRSKSGRSELLLVSYSESLWKHLNVYR